METRKAKRRQSQACTPVRHMCILGAVPRGPAAAKQTKLRPTPDRSAANDVSVTSRFPSFGKKINICRKRCHANSLKNMSDWFSAKDSI